MTAIFSYLRRRAVLALICLCMTAVSLGIGAAPAHATEAFRQELPIQAGTELHTPSHYCTAGAVLKSNSLMSELSAYLKEIRYVVIAGHCATEGTEVNVGPRNGIGKVVWVSSRADIELVKVEPISRPHWTCDPGSTLHHCGYSTYYTPRAIGNIFLFAPPGGIRSIPIRGTAVPGGGETFCTSGARSGVNCTWSTATLPVSGLYGRAGATTWAHNVVSGDSGGPVAGTGGQLYGIISQGGIPGGDTPDMMNYVPMATVFEELPGYVLAPPG